MDVSAGFSYLFTEENYFPQDLEHLKYYITRLSPSATDFPSFFIWKGTLYIKRLCNSYRRIIGRLPAAVALGQSSIYSSSSGSYNSALYINESKLFFYVAELYFSEGATRFDVAPFLYWR